MSALKMVLAGGSAAAALFAAAPASAQYYPGNASPYGSPYSNPYSNGHGAYGPNNQAVVGQCVAAVQARLNGGGYGDYGYNTGYGQGRVLGISRIEPRQGGGLTVRGAANSGRSGYAYGGQVPVDLTFRCTTDFRGFITNVQVRPARSSYGYNATPYASPETSPYSNDYSQYGYSRY
jgi:hypothetical protein